MKTETQTAQKVTSLGLSKALNGAGAKQESEASWSKNPFDPDEQWTLVREPVEQRSATDWVAAFDCPELLEQLPSHISDGNKEYWLTLEKLGDEYHAMYFEYHHGSFDKEAVEVLGRLLLWGLENGHCKKSGSGS